MVVKIYVSGISGNKEVKKRQQRVLMILDSKNIKYEVVDITEPGSEDSKEFMQSNSKSLGATVGDANPRHPLPPQLFNDEDYCGDYDQFDLSNEIDEIEKFLKLAPDDSAPAVTSNAEIKVGNGEVEKESAQSTVVNEDQTEHDTENAVGEVQNNTTEDDGTLLISEPKENTETEINAKLENGNVEADTTDDTA